MSNNKKQGERREDAISPVIGVILTVAITVILAAVIGAFVLQIGSGQETVPNARFDFTEGEQYSAGFGTDVEVKIKHKVGDVVQEEQITVLVNGEQAQDGGGNAIWDGTGEISAGDSVIVDQYPSAPGGHLQKGDSIEIKWENKDGSRTTILQEYEISTLGGGN